MHFDIQKHTILLVRGGSHAYGTNVPESDLDVRGIAIAPRSHVLGFAYEFEQHITKDPDSTIFGHRKFFKLAADCNPNIIEILFADDSDVLTITPEGRTLREIRDLFLSRKARHTFAGYAFQQLKRIKTHRKWLLEPPKEKPTRESFGLHPHDKTREETLGAVEALQNEGAVISPAVMQVLHMERQYGTALKQWQQYQNWKHTRNEARAALEAKHGYDTKHAMHLVRLLRMCREILAEGKVLVRRPDADELRAIRRGEWTYDELISWAEDMDAGMDAAYAASPLPRAPKMDVLNYHCVRLAEAFWERVESRADVLDSRNAKAPPAEADGT